MRVLVTGGAGFIGSHTCVVLLQKGYEIIVLDSYANSNENSLSNLSAILGSDKNNNELKIEIKKGDIRDEKL